MRILSNHSPTVMLSASETSPREAHPPKADRSPLSQASASPPSASHGDPSLTLRVTAVEVSREVRRIAPGNGNGGGDLYMTGWSNR